MFRLFRVLGLVAVATSMVACSDGAAPFGNVQGPKKPESLTMAEQAKAAKLAANPGPAVQGVTAPQEPAVAEKPAAP